MANDTHDSWGALRWPEAADRLPRCRVALLPVGSTEAHGPHLPLDTDVIIAQAMARAGAARLADRGVDALVLPPVCYGVTDFARDFPGTLSLPAGVVTAQVAAIARAVSSWGLSLLCLVNAHLEPAHVQALHRACAEVDGAAPGFRVIFPDVTRRRWAQVLTPEFRSGACHAGRYESSVVLHERAGGVDRAAMASLPGVPISLSQAIHEGRHSFREAGGDRAYFGWPADASAEEGARIVARLGAIAERAIGEALEDPSADVNDPRRDPGLAPLDGEPGTAPARPPPRVG